MSAVECRLDGDAIVVAEQRRKGSKQTSGQSRVGSNDADIAQDDSSTSPHSSPRESPSSPRHTSSSENDDVMKNCYDSDEDDDEVEELSWRLDPESSLSDWTVYVSVKASPSSSATPPLPARPFHVHKSVLAVGPRRSPYFARVFATHVKASEEAVRVAHARAMEKKMKALQSPSSVMETTLEYFKSTAAGVSIVGNASPHLSPSRRSTTTTAAAAESASSPALHHQAGSPAATIEPRSSLELEQLALDALPVALDYMYSSSGRLEIHTRNAVALHVLAERLEIKLLKRKTREFWTADLSMDNLTTYYRHARIFQHHKILTYAEDFCAQHMFEVREHAVISILTAVDPYFFLRVVTHPQVGEGTSTSLRLSLLIAVYCNLHKKELDASIFRKLTDPKHLPVVEVKAAIALLEMEDDICGNIDEMSSLKDRCMSVLSSNWEEACISEDESGTSVLLPRLAGQPLKKFVCLTLVKAKEGIIILNRENTKIQQQKEALESVLEEQPNITKRLKQAEQDRDGYKKENEKLEKQLHDLRLRMDKMILAARRTHNPAVEESYSSFEKESKDLKE